VQGNLVGLDVAGTGPLPNGGFGLLLDGGSSSNTIDGPRGGANQVGPNGAGPIRNVNLDRPTGAASPGRRARREAIAARRLALLAARRMQRLARLSAARLRRALPGRGRVPGTPSP
jgi:hypothetical protein